MALDRAKINANAEKLVKAGKIPEALAEYRRLVEDNSRDMGALNKLGDLCVRAGKNPDAIRYFLRIAEFYASDGFFLKAIAMYKKVSKLDPANLDCQVKLAGLYQQQGLTIEAKAQYLSLGDRFIKSGQFKKAAEIFPHVLEIEPENMKARMTYAELLVRVGSVKDAGREFRHVAQELAKKGLFDEAIKVAQKGVKAVPGDTEMMSLALALTKEGEKSPGDMLATVEQMAKANGDNPRSLALLGEAYLAAGKGAQAEKVFQKLRGMDEAPPEVCAAVTRYHISKKQADASSEWMVRAVEGYETASRPEDAAGLLDEFLRAFPNHRDALSRRADLAARSGNREVQVETLTALAEAHLGAGESDAAAAVVARLQEVDPKNPAHADLLTRITGGGTGGARVASREPRAPASARPAPAAKPRVPDVQEGALELEGEAVDETPPEEEITGSDALGEVEAEIGSGPQSRIQDMADEPDEEGEEPEDDEFISEHFTEAEVFVKYGLLEKAKEQLFKILEKYPKHVASHTKLKEIHYEEGDKDKAVAECLALAALLKEKNRREQAQDFINEAIRIDPNNPAVKEVTGVTEPPAPPPAPSKAARPAAPSPPPAVPKIAAQPAPRAGKPPAPTRTPELELEEIPGDDALEIEPTSLAAGPATVDEEAPDDGGLDLEIEVPEAPAARTPAPKTPPVAAKATRRETAPRASGRPVPEKIEEETPDDLPGEMSLDGAADEITIEVEDDGGGPAMVPGGDVPAPAAAAVAARDPDPEKLGEVDFYIDQGLHEEARAVLFQLQKQYPDSQEVTQRFERANRPGQVEPSAGAQPEPQPEPSGLDLDVERAFGAQTVVLPASRPVVETVPRAAKAKPVFKVEKKVEAAAAAGDFFDLAGELDRSLSEAQVAVDTEERESIEGPGHSIDEIFKAFKKGVEQQVDSQDYETHYNLGIAYKEMGLVDEAIGEFQYAARDPGKTVECCEILGLCFREKGMPQLALKWYQKGLDMPNLGEHEAIGLRYDIAEVYREQGDYKKAMLLYTEVYGLDSTYRDVAAKIKEMKKHLG